MKKSTKITWISVAVAIIILGAVLAFGLKSQTAIGYAPTQADCNDRMKNQWCVQGYSCTPCSQYTLSYYLQFDSGTTNKVWTSDCTYGTTPTDSAHTACQASSNIIAHAKSHCYNGDVYWYNSIGKLDSIKQDCNNGCSDYTLDSAKCNDAPITTPLGQKVCMPGTNYLCTDALYTGGAWYCSSVDNKEYCAYGCENGACKAQTCKNTCDTQGYVECESTTSRRICGVYDNAPCLSWKTGYGCANNQVCSNGQCVTAPTPIVITDPVVTPTPDVTPECIDYGVTSCVSKYTYHKCNSDGTLGSLKQCADGTSCDAGKCVAIPVVTPPIVTDSCADVKCPDYCDADLGLHAQGSCNNGACVYQKGETNSPSCIGAKVTESSGTPAIFWIGIGIIVLGGIIAVIFISKKSKK